MASLSDQKRKIRIAAVAAALLGAFGLSSGNARGPASAETRPEEPRIATLAEQMFPDAAYGVDPMVTGPVSAEFKAQQKAAGCDDAVWPAIPASCFPN